MCAPEASALRSWHAALCRRHDRYHLRPHDEHRAVLAVCKSEGIIGDLIEGAFNTLIGQSGCRHNAHLLADKQLVLVPVELVINLAGLRGRLLFLDDLAAEVDTLVADVDPTRTRDQPLHLILALAAEGATVCHTGALCVRHILLALFL